MIKTFSEDNFKAYCDKLTKRSKQLKAVVAANGYPPMWTRKQGFETLILTILEQQVSLASAYAAYKKLKEKTRTVTPQKILLLTDEELRACYFSRQKIVYARELAKAVLSKQLNLKQLPSLQDEEVRATLTSIKGIGNWTADVYLMHALQRTDLFPLGDVALVSSLKDEMQLPAHISKEEMLAVAELWRPYRTIAAMILWHAYIKKRNLKINV